MSCTSPPPPHPPINSKLALAHTAHTHEAHHTPPPLSIPNSQVEARLRQLEGRALAGDSATPRADKGETPKYDAARQSGAKGLAATPKAYNADGDVVAEANGKKEKKEKKEKKRKAEANGEEAAPKKKVG